MASLSRQLSKLNRSYLSRSNSGRGDIDRRTFSLSTGIAVRSNIIGGSLGSGKGVGDNTTIKIPNRTLDCWIRTMDELYAYELFELLQNIIKLIKDYLTKLIDSETSEYFSIADDPDLTTKFNKFIKDSGITPVFIDDLNSLIYYGSCGHHIKWGYNEKGEKSWIIVDLPDPHKILEIKKLVTEDKVLVNKKTGSRKTIEIDKIISRFVLFTDDNKTLLSVDPSQIIHFTTEGIRLENDERLAHLFDEDNIKSKLVRLEETKLRYAQTIKATTNKVSLSDVIKSSGSSASVTGSKSIFYSLIDQIKEYVVKKALQSVLGTKDLLMPTLLKLGYDLNQATDTSEVAKTINEIETKINDAVDMSILSGERLDIGGILNAAFSTVRVIPDPNSLLSQLDVINTQPIQDKFDKIKEEVTTVSDGIKDSLGIPSDLFDGGSNQYEVLTRSQRYETTISTMCNNLRDTYIFNVIKLCELSGEFEDKELELIKTAKCNVFKPSTIEITHRTTLITQQQELARAINDLINAYSEMIRDNVLIIDDEALNRLRESLRYIDPEMINMVVTEAPKQEDDVNNNW